MVLYPEWLLGQWSLIFAYNPEAHEKVGFLGKKLDLLTSSTTEALEMRICADEGTNNNEDIPIAFMRFLLNEDVSLRVIWMNYYYT